MIVFDALQKTRLYTDKKITRTGSNAEVIDRMHACGTDDPA